MRPAPPLIENIDIPNMPVAAMVGKYFRNQPAPWFKRKPKMRKVGEVPRTKANMMAAP